jgi:hypothetical protein
MARAVFLRAHPGAVARDSVFAVDGTSVFAVRSAVLKPKTASWLSWAFYCGSAAVGTTHFFLVGFNAVGSEVMQMWEVPVDAVAGKDVIRIPLNLVEEAQSRWSAYAIHTEAVLFDGGDSVNEEFEARKKFNSQFVRGDMKTYVATLSFHVGEAKLDVHRGEEILYDGQVAEIAGLRVVAMTLRKSIECGWLVLQRVGETVNVDEYYQRPRSAQIMLSPADQRKAAVEGRKAAVAGVAMQDERVVGNVQTFSARSSAATKSAWDNRVAAIPGNRGPVPSQRQSGGAVSGLTDQEGRSVAEIIQEQEEIPVSGVAIRVPAKAGRLNVFKAIEAQVQTRPVVVGPTSSLEAEGVKGTGVVMDRLGRPMERPSETYGMDRLSRACGVGAIAVDSDKDIAAAEEVFRALPDDSAEESALDAVDMEIPDLECPVDPNPDVPESVLTQLLDKPVVQFENKIKMAQKCWPNFPTCWPFRKSEEVRMGLADACSESRVALKAIFVAEAVPFQMAMLEKWPDLLM